MEHRHGMRYRALTVVEIESKYGNSLGLMSDIGADGMFVLSEEVPDINDSISIHMPQPGAGRAPVRIQGLVVHRRERGFGVLFRNMDSRIQAHVDSLLRR